MERLIDFKPLADFKPHAELKPSSVYTPQANFKPSSVYTPQASFKPAFNFQPRTDFKSQTSFKPQMDFKPQANFKTSLDSFTPGIHEESKPRTPLKDVRAGLNTLRRGLNMASNDEKLAYRVGNRVMDYAHKLNHKLRTLKGHTRDNPVFKPMGTNEANAAPVNRAMTSIPNILKSSHGVFKTMPKRQAPIMEKAQQKPKPQKKAVKNPQRNAVKQVKTSRPTAVLKRTTPAMTMAEPPGPQIEMIRGLNREVVDYNRAEGGGFGSVARRRGFEKPPGEYERMVYDSTDPAYDPSLRYQADQKNAMEKQNSINQTDLSTARINADATRYSADKSAEASRYSADKNLASSIQRSDGNNSYEVFRDAQEAGEAEAQRLFDQGVSDSAQLDNARREGFFRWFADKEGMAHDTYEGKSVRVSRDGRVFLKNGQPFGYKR